MAKIRLEGNKVLGVCEDVRRHPRYNTMLQHQDLKTGNWVTILRNRSPEKITLMLQSYRKFDGKYPINMDTDTNNYTLVNNEVVDSGPKTNERVAANLKPETKKEEKVSGINVSETVVQKEKREKSK